MLRSSDICRALCCALAARACDLGSGRGCLGLGILILRGPLDRADAAEAVRHLHRGCELGEPRACEREASHLWVGVGTVRDETRAREIFVAACRGGAQGTCRPDPPSDPPPALPEHALCAQGLCIAI
jgi:hypothetical protein